LQTVWVYDQGADLGAGEGGGEIQDSQGEWMSQVRLYRFFNFEVGKRGEPWAMCDPHYKNYRPPITCIIEKLADQAEWPCNQCEQETDAAIEASLEASLEASGWSDELLV